MSATLVRPPAPPAFAPQKRTIVELSVFEGRRLLRHPATLAGLVASVALVVHGSFDQVPVLFSADLAITRSLLLLAGLTLLVTNAAVLRARRDEIEPLLSTLPSERRRRVAAHLVAVAWPTLAALAVVAVEIVWLRLSGGVGAPSLAQLVSGPSMVALGGVAGVALGVLLPWVAAAPLVVLAVGLVQADLLATIPVVAPPGALAWLAPTYAPPLLDRPTDLGLVRAGPHLIYLVGLVIVVAALALGGQPLVARLGRLARRRDQVIPLGSRRAPRGHRSSLVVGVAGLVGVALAAAGGAVVTSRTPPSGVSLIASYLGRPAAHQSCRTRAGATYCAYPAFLPWVSRWALPVEGVLAALPAAPPGRLVIRQLWSPGAGFSFDPGLTAAAAHHLDAIGGTVFQSETTYGASAYVATTWGHHGQAGNAQFALALQVARWAVGLPDRYPPGPHTPAFSIPYQSCNATGQAREVVALWLAGQASPAAASWLRSTVEGAAPGGFNYDPAGVFAPRAPYVDWTLQDARLAGQMLDQAHHHVDRVLAARWSHWLAASTPTAELARALDLVIPSAAPAPVPGQGTGTFAVVPSQNEPACR